MRTLAGFALTISVALLAACGGSQPPSLPGAMPVSTNYPQKSFTRNVGRATGTVEFAFVANFYSNNVSAYAIDASNGALMQVQGSPFAAGFGPSAVAIDPTGNFAYVANNGSVSGKQPGSVSAFTINPRSGALTAVQGSPFAAGSNPLGVAISPNGKFAYVINYNSANVSVFAINESTGTLKQVKGSPFTTPHFPTAEAIDPTGKFAYVTHEDAEPYYHRGHILGYAISKHNGALRTLQRTGKVAGWVPDSAAIDPSGKFIYVANYTSGTVSAYPAGLFSLTGSPYHSIHETAKAR